MTKWQCFLRDKIGAMRHYRCTVQTGNSFKHDSCLGRIGFPWSNFIKNYRYGGIYEQWQFVTHYTDACVHKLKDISDASGECIIYEWDQHINVLIYVYITNIEIINDFNHCFKFLIWMTCYVTNKALLYAILNYSHKMFINACCECKYYFCYQSIFTIHIIVTKVLVNCVCIQTCNE